MHYGNIDKSTCLEHLDQRKQCVNRSGILSIEPDLSGRLEISVYMDTESVDCLIQLMVLDCVQADLHIWQAAQAPVDHPSSANLSVF